SHMVALRFIGALFALAAVIALVADLTPRASTNAVRPGMTSIAMHWNGIAPQSFSNAREAVRNRLGRWVWDPVITSVIGIPAWITLGLISAACFYVGRPRRRIEIFTN